MKILTDNPQIRCSSCGVEFTTDKDMLDPDIGKKDCLLL